MLPKPSHLGPEYAAQFADRSVAEAYPHRPPYPAEVFDLLLGLLPAAAARSVACDATSPLSGDRDGRRIAPRPVVSRR